MELTKDQKIKKYGKKCMNCSLKTLFPYKFEYTSVSCGNNVIKRKKELTKKQRKKTSFINRLKYAELKTFCNCEDVYKLYECEDFDKVYEALSKLGKKLKIKNELIAEYKKANKFPDFKQNYHSRLAVSKNKIGYDSVTLLEWMAYYDQNMKVSTFLI